MISQGGERSSHQREKTLGMVERPREKFQNDSWRADRSIWEAKFWSLVAWKGASWKKEAIVLRAASWTRPERQEFS